VSDKWTVAECFGVNIDRWKRQRGLSLAQIAERAGIHRTHVSLLIRGKRVARIDTAIKVAQALEIPLEALFEGIKWDGKEFYSTSNNNSDLAAVQSESEYVEGD
jgi:transcriptional regulator with XRE-family HTH domain